MAEPTLQNYFDLAAWTYNSGLKPGTPDADYTAFAVNGPHYASKNNFDAYAPNAGFYGAAYSIGTGSDKSVVIGFEGTNIEAYATQTQFVYNAVKADLGLYKGQLPTALQLAAQFANSVIQTAAAQGISKDHVYITGHSLGAAEAEYADVQTGLTGVTFGTPGISADYIPAGSSSDLTNYVERGDPVGNYAYTGKNSPEGSFIYSHEIGHFGATQYLGTFIDALPLQAAATAWATGTTTGKAQALGVLAGAAKFFHPLTVYASSLNLSDAGVPAGASSFNVSQLQGLLAAIASQGGAGVNAASTASAMHHPGRGAGASQTLVAATLPGATHHPFAAG